MAEKKRSALEEFDAAPDALAEFDAAPDVTPSEVQRRETAAREALQSRSGQMPQLPSASTEFLGPGSVSGAALRGFGRGASLGLADVGSGLVRAAMMAPAKTGQALATALGGEDVGQEIGEELGYVAGGIKGAGRMGYLESLLEAYRKGRDESALEALQARKTRPITTVGSELAGGVAMPMPAVSRIGGAPLSTLGKLAVGGGISGAVSGFGTSEADLTRGEVGKATAETLKGAAMGATLAPAIGLAAQRAAPAIEKWASENALKAIGVKAGLSEALAGMGYESNEESRALGRAAMEMGLVPPFSKAETVLRLAEEAQPRYGAQIEDVLTRADEAAATREAMRQADFKARLAAAIKEGKGTPVWQPEERPAFDVGKASWEAVGSLVGEGGLSPTAIRETPRAQKLVEDIMSLPAVQEPSFAAANRLKSDMYKGIKYGVDPKLATEMEQRVAGSLRRSIEEQAGETVAGVQGAEEAQQLIDQLRTANLRWGQLEDVQRLARKEAERQMARKSVTPFQLTMGALSGAAGSQAAGPLGGVAGFALPQLWNLLSPRYASTLANVQKGLAPRLPGMAAMGTQPAIFEAASPSLSEREAAQQARANAFDELSRRFGISAETPEAMSQEAFLLQQQGKLAPP